MTNQEEKMTETVFVQGNCPACGVAAVFVGDGGYLTCSLISCSNPLAPSEALGVIFWPASPGTPS